MPTLLFFPGALALAAALAAAPVAPAVPAGAGVSYTERASAQRRFVEEYVKSHPASGPLAAPADLDRFFAELQAAWAKSLGEGPPDPVLARLDPQIYLTAMLAWTERKPPDWARCHLWSHHALPAFYADLDTMRAGPGPGRPALIDSITTVHVLSYPVLSCDVTPEEWNRYYAAMDELPRLLDTYLDRRAYDDGGDAKRLRQARDSARGLRPRNAVAYALKHGDLSLSLRELAEGFAGGAWRDELAKAGHELADAHGARGEVDEALSVLDRIARSTAVSDVPDETLRDWYAKADPQRGPERYARAASGRLPVLAPTDERVQLAGRYEDLATGRPLDLASLAGKTVLLDFWATWCTICLAEVPQLNALAERLGRDGKLVIVGVSSDALTGKKPPESAVRDLARKKGMQYHVIYDRPQGSLTEQLRVEAWPTRVLIDGDGWVLSPPGSIERRPKLEEIEAYLDSRLPAATPVTPAASSTRGATGW